MANKKGISENQITDLVSKYKKIETNVNNWLTNPPLPALAEVATATCVNGAVGAAASVFFETIAINISSVLPVPPPFKVISGRPLINARNWGLSLGASAGIQCAMKKIRGKDDVQNKMVAGFGGGVLFAMASREHPATVIAYGILLSLAKGGLFKALEKPKSSQ